MLSKKGWRMLFMNWNIDIKDLFAKLKGGRSGGKKPEDEN